MNEQGKTLAEKVADEIFCLVQDQHYAPGVKMPTEKELCVMMKAGRNTVREALKILASRNVVVIRQGSGTFISDKQGVSDDPFGFAMMKDPKKLTHDLIQIRVIIEPAIAALAAQCATREDLAELEVILDKMEAVIRKRGDYALLDVDFHAKIAECTHNIVMRNLIPVISRGVLVFSRTVGETEYKQTMFSHRRIFEHIRNRHPFEAEQEMRFHLLFNQDRYLNEDSEER